MKAADGSSTSPSFGAGSQPATMVRASEDRRFVMRMDARLAAAKGRAGGLVTCRLGCIECCIGLFDITALDALRLRWGLARLARRDPGRAAALVARARVQWAVIRGEFPVDPGTGELTGDDVAREAFFAAHEDLPCPGLDPTTGACELYESRPVSCRTFGLPIRCGDEVLPPCRLNFVGASGGEIAAAAVDPDPEDAEGELLVRLGDGAGTVVARTLVRSPDEANFAATSSAAPSAVWPR